MNTKLYLSDLTDAEWQIIAPLVERKTKVGAPTELDIHAVVNAIFYLVDNGIKWRATPHDFPDWRSSTTTLRSGATMEPCKNLTCLRSTSVGASRA